MRAPVLELSDVSFQRDGRPILSSIGLTVREGEHWALIGPNGAGKSTLLALCGAVAHPSSGTVQVLGRQLGRVELQALRRELGHVNPRHPARPHTTVRQVVLSGLTGSTALPPRWQPDGAQSRRCQELIERVGLSARSDSRWELLSQGERGRALIARALITDPRLLLLDEPSTGLDIAAREQLLKTLADLTGSRPRIASVLVTHHLEELPETTSHALVMARGAVVSSGPLDTALTTAAISEAFEHPIEVIHDAGRWSARSAR